MCNMFLILFFFFFTQLLAECTDVIYVFVVI